MEKQIKNLIWASLIVVGLIIGLFIGNNIGYSNAKDNLLFNPEKDICDIAVANNDLLAFNPSIEQLDCIHIELSSVGEGLFCITENMSLPVRCIQWHDKSSTVFRSGFNTQRYYEQGGFFSSQP